MIKPGLLLITLISTLLHGQQAQIIFDHYGLSAGFNSREATDIVTSANGMAWISSNDGLVRFDSKRFKFYQHVEGDTFSLSNNYCQALAIDKRGVIWVQSDDNLDLFNPITERFFHITLPDSNGNRKPVYPHKFVYDSASDIMWIATAKGLYFSRQGQYKLQSINMLCSDKNLENTHIGALEMDGNEYLWLTAGNQIIRLNTKNGLTQKHVLPGKLDGVVNDPELVRFFSAYLDENKTLWLGTWLKGLVAFNTITHTFNQYCFSDYTKDDNTIFDITQTHEPGQEETLWLSTTGIGLTTFNTATKKFKSYHSKVTNDPYGIKGTTYGLHADGKKGMWIGAASGLHRYDYSKQLFKTINLSNITKGNGLPAVNRMVIQKSKTGQDEVLWFYIPYKGGYLYNLVENKMLPLPSKVAGYINIPIEFLGYFIDSKNILWISSIDHGLIGFDIENNKIIFKDNKKFTEKNKWVSCLFEDSKNRIWIGSFDGLYLMDINRQTITTVGTVNNFLIEKGLAHTIEDITEDETGNIWFIADGTDKKMACIGKLNPANNRLEIVYNEKNEQQINKGPVGLRNIVSNRNGKIFVSFYAEGIAWYSSDGDTTHSHLFGSENGLNSARIGELVADKNGNIWCSTSFGFSVYKLAQNKFFNYSYDTYGMDNTMEPVMYLSPQSGFIYIGQSGAIRYFNPANEVKNNKSGYLVFSELKVLNKVINHDGKLFTNGDTIELTHKQNMVSIEFALLSFTNAEDNTYSWKLQDWEEGWNTSSNNIATYINLQPGTYTLWVKAANNQGDWTKEPIKLTLTIAYPFYQTWWFIVLCVLSLAALVYWFVQQRIGRIKEKYQLRNKIAADLHDEIGSTLTSINILSNVSQQAMDQQPQEAKGMLQQISAQSKVIQQSMSDIVWSIRPDNDKVGDLLTRMREYASQTLEQLDIDIVIEADDELAAKTLPMQYRKELLLIYKEAINNIARHAGATKVLVALKNGNKNLQLTIADNGKWKGASTGTGTRSMKERAKTMGGTLEIVPSATGTEVKAIIPVP